MTRQGSGPKVFRGKLHLDLKKSLVRTIKLKKIALRSGVSVPGNIQDLFDKTTSSVIKGSAFSGRLKNTISKGQSLLNFSDFCNSASAMTLCGKYYCCLPFEGYPSKM